MTTPDPTPEDVRALGTLLAGEVDGAVDELAAYILASDWLAQRDARIRAEALREAAAALYDGAGDPEQEFYNRGVAPWLRGRADAIEAGEQP